ncbi:hypothetical protein M2137_002075 [Parabacteroides sp. PFB2-10]|uniref:DUF4884 domain-containing protein n=1 Tax=Parabacteroides sp. PFB2-10 TaxID=1742405 RepID=UPI002475DFF3|nr:DUF4884 domain-containing protein [Parabacteroides sp. PFB2-10]MDH6313285.1 hypothetical protein [Parabacteroides sp. PFB2-10]MDL2245702.1 DUF4884 domain-containing protein [Parabacteroides sp. OttesenSCG-928-J18]
MKKILLRSGLCCLLATLFSCYSSIPLSQGASDNNSTYNVQYLFEHDGCKVYRFMDMGNYVYFTNCEGSVTAIQNDSTAQRVTNQVRINKEY